MPDYPNLHRELNNGQIHPPRDYSIAGNSTYLGRDIHGELKWEREFWGVAVDGFITDQSMASTADGARYVISSSVYVSSSASFGGADNLDIVEYLTTDYDGNVVNRWDFISPQEGLVLFVKGEGTFYYFDGSAWQPLQSGSGGQATPDDVTITFTGSNSGTYIDLYDSTVGNIVKQVLFRRNSTLDDQGASVKVVLHDGNPSNDIELTGEVLVEDINGSVLYDLGGNGDEVTSGFTIKLLVVGADIDFGTLRIITYYLP